MNDGNLTNELSSITGDKASVGAKISSLSQEIDELNELVTQNENTIRSNMEYNPDNYNQGLGVVKKGSTKRPEEGNKIINGENDDAFLDPYYDEEGNPYYYINQYCPIYAFIDHNGQSARGGACGPSSETNSFITAYGVHSLIDTIGIFSYFLKLTCTSGDRHAIASFTSGNPYINQNGEKVPNRNMDQFFYLEKYLLDEEGNYKTTLYKGIDDVDYDGINDEMNGKDEYQFVIPEFGSFADLDSLVAKLEAQGYDVQLTFGGMSFGMGNTPFGGKTSGHYGAMTYETGDGIAILDSSGQRTFEYETEATEWLVGPDGVVRENELGDKDTKGNISEDEMWHETTSRIGTSYSSFSDIQRRIKCTEVGGPLYVKVKRRK